MRDPDKTTGHLILDSDWQSVWERALQSTAAHFRGEHEPPGGLN